MRCNHARACRVARSKVANVVGDECAFTYTFLSYVVDDDGEDPAVGAIPLSPSLHPAPIVFVSLFSLLFSSLLAVRDDTMILEEKEKV